MWSRQIGLVIKGSSLVQWPHCAFVFHNQCEVHKAIAVFLEPSSIYARLIVGKNTNKVDTSNEYLADSEGELCSRYFCCWR